MKIKQKMSLEMLEYINACECPKEQLLFNIVVSCF